MSKKYINNKFTGEIDGICASDYYNKIKLLKTTSIEEQIQKTHDILGTEFIGDKEFYDDFLTKVFLQNDEDEYLGGIKLILNKTDDLYSDSNIAKILERIGSDILKKDVKKDNKNYMKVYNSVKLFEKARDEQEELMTIANRTAEGRYAIENGLDDMFSMKDMEKCLNKRDENKNIDVDDLIVLANTMNYKLEKRIDKLSDNDLEILNKIYGERFPIVNTYFQAYKNMKKEFVKLTQNPRCEWEHIKDKDIRKKKKFKKMNNNEDRIKKKLMSRNIYTLREDFIDSIYSKARFIMFKAPLPDKGCPSWDEFDILDKEHIRYALPLTKGNDMQDDLSVIIRDLNNTIEECEFTKMQSDVLELLRKDKTQEDMGHILNISKQVVNSHINAIVNRIYNKNLEKYTDWYYLNICKATYKKCSKCGEIKLIQEFDKNGKQGYMSMCKKCRKK